MSMTSSSMVLAQMAALARASRCNAGFSTVSSRKWSPRLKQQRSSSSSLEAAKEEDIAHKQEFVKVRLEPGEWNSEKTDPIARPPWQNRSRIMSAEDFAYRPRIGFSTEFKTMGDAMLVHSWLDRKTQETIYQAYLDMMIAMSETETVTSHEYVTKVLAQRFNIIPKRVAAVVQLLHEEQQTRKNHPERKIYYATQAYVDASMAVAIAQCYDLYRETPPGEFVEDPIDIAGDGAVDRQRGGFVSVEDLVDVDKLVARSIARDEERARLLIDEHHYIEDGHESRLTVKVSANCHKLMASQQRLKQAVGTPLERPEIMKPPPGHGEGKVRNRWKFVAKVIDTVQEKTQRAKKRKNKNKNEDLLVEHNGQLRVANIADVKGTSYKPKRDVLEFTYGGVKQAWIERQQGKTDGWGRVAGPPSPEELELAARVEEVVKAQMLASTVTTDIDGSDSESAEFEDIDGDSDFPDDDDDE